MAGEPLDLDRVLEVAEEAARAAGALIKASWGKAGGSVAGGSGSGAGDSGGGGGGGGGGAVSVAAKGGNAADLVTDVDEACEALIRERIRGAFPDHAFIGEEESAARKARGNGDAADEKAGGGGGGEAETAGGGGGGSAAAVPTWMVDPLDGTANFVHGFPFSCTSIALCVGGEPVVGVVYNPIIGELFSASKGRGAFLNGRRLACGPRGGGGGGGGGGAEKEGGEAAAAARGDDEEGRGTQEEEDDDDDAPPPHLLLSRALIGTEIGTSRDAETMDAVFRRVRAVTAASRSLRCGGSCALGLCGVAAGRLDAFYEIGFGGCWDVAAGALVVREAGGVVVDPAGGPWAVGSRRVLAAADARTGRAVAALLREAGTAASEPGPP